MALHQDDYLYVCPFCYLDLETSQDVVSHIMKWHPKRAVRVCMKQSEVFHVKLKLFVSLVVTTSVYHEQ